VVVVAIPAVAVAGLDSVSMIFAALDSLGMVTCFLILPILCCNTVYLYVLLHGSGPGSFGRRSDPSCFARVSWEGNNVI